MTQQHRLPDTASKPNRKAVLLVFLGGALGVLISTLIRAQGLRLVGYEALPLLLVNVVGAMLLGVLVGLIPDAKDQRRLFLGTGLLGGFTSFSAIPASLFPPLKAVAEMHGTAGEPSTYSTEIIGRDPVLDHTGLEGLILAPVSLLVGVLAAALGLWLAQKMIDRRQAGDQS